MKTLAITTSTNRCAVALLLGAEPVAARIVDEDRLHAERIFALIDDALLEAAWTKEELGLVACDLGPGSFTGVRVGLATAKGIALGLGIPIVGVGSLEAMAAAVIHGTLGAPVLAVIDAPWRTLCCGVCRRRSSDGATPRRERGPSFACGGARRRLALVRRRKRFAGRCERAAGSGLPFA